MTAFRVGMKVCCVDDSWTDFAWLNGKRVQHDLNRLPMLNEVLTVDRIVMGGPDGKTPYLTFREIERGSWHPSFFRPIVSRPTSIAVFQAMLTGKKAGVEA